MDCCKQKQQKVSVVIPAYNRAHTIKNAISSIQSQTYTDWEIIVVDDGSTDDTCAVVTKMAKEDTRIKLVKHEKNRKAQAARNTGINSAQGEWIAFLDSDDEYLIDSIENRLKLAEKEQVQVVHSECYIVKPGCEKEIYKIRPLSGNVYKEMLEKEGPVFPSLLVKKQVLEQIGFLDEKIKAYQEWDTSIRLAKKNRFAFCSKPTFIYDYRGADSMSRNSILNAQGYSQIVRKHFFAIWKILGASGVAFHYDKASAWYTEGNDKINAGRCALIATFWKCVSLKRIKSRIRFLLFKKSY